MTHLLGADVRRLEVPVPDVRLGVEIQQPFDRGARRVAVVAEAVGEDGSPEVLEAGAHPLLHQIVRPPAPVRPLPGDAGRKILLGAEIPRQVAEEPRDDRDQIPPQSHPVPRRPRPVTPPAALGRHREQRVDPPVALRQAHDLAADAVPHHQQPAGTKMPADPLQHAGQIEPPPVQHAGAEPGEALRPGTADPTIVIAHHREALAGQMAGERVVVTAPHRRGGVDQHHRPLLTAARGRLIEGGRQPVAVQGRNPEGRIDARFHTVLLRFGQSRCGPTASR
jgi:hypothetical protein